MLGSEIPLEKIPLVLELSGPAIYLAKLLTSKSLPEIGRSFSNRDHTTVIHSVKTIEKLRKEDNELNINIDNLKNKILYNKENEI